LIEPLVARAHFDVQMCCSFDFDKALRITREHADQDVFFCIKQQEEKVTKTMSKPKRNLAGVPGVLRNEIRRKSLIDEAARNANLKVIALLAPIGFGKTTTLAQLVRQDFRDVVWVTLSEEEALAESLGQRLALSLQSVLQKATFSSWTALQSTGTTDQVKARALAEDLNSADSNLILVLDRIEHLGVNASKWLEAFIDALSEGHQVLLAGFESTPLPLARWVANGIAYTFGPKELMFSEREGVQFLSDSREVSHPHDLHRRLEGWPAGIALVGSGASAFLSPEDLILERIDRLPEGLRDGLAELTVIEEWQESTAQLFGVELPRGWIKQVLEGGLLLSPIANGRYRVHSVLLEALEMRLRERPQAHARQHLRAAELCNESGRKLEALRHFRLAQRLERALELGEEIAFGLVSRREFSLARQVLENFDFGQLTPDMKVYLGETLIETGQPDVGESMLRSLRESGFQSGQLLLILAARANLKGQFEDQLSLIEEALVLDINHRMRALLLLFKSDGLEYLGEVGQSVTCARLAVTEAELSGDGAMLAKTVTRLAGALGNANVRIDSEQQFLRALKLYDSLGMQRRKLDVLNNLANFYSEWGQVSSALEAIQQAFEIDMDGTDSVQTVMLGTRGLIRLTWGLVHEAFLDFQAGLALAIQFSMTRFQFKYNIWLCEAACLIGNLPEARQSLARAIESGSGTAMLPVQHSLIAFCEGLIALREGNEQELKRLWDSIDQDSISNMYLTRILLYRAEVDRRVGTLDFGQVEAIFASWNQADGDAALITDAPLLSKLYTVCIEKNWYAPRFQAVLDRKSEPPVVGRAFGLKIQTFGPGAVIVDGDEVKLPLVKCLELLAYLGINGPSTLKMIVRALFDGSRRRADVDHSRVVIRRLRNTLASDADLPFNPIVFDGTRYALNLAFQVDCDAKKELDFSSNLPQGAVEKPWLLESNRDFLEKCDTDWVHELRTVLTDIRVEKLIAFGLLQEADSTGAALEAYRQAIELDPLADAAYEGIIRVQSHLGNTAAVSYTQSLLEKSIKKNLLS
jgi:LuxR family transcriptional regulator, maltose regulon positive regulatory protein